MENTANAQPGDLLAGLNDAQREAVLAVRGPVVILAGAGTGKTTTITRRIAQQVASGEFGADQILAVAFTTKAAREMGRRLASLGANGVRTNTFHAEALAQFRRLSPHRPDILSSKGQILHGIVKALPMPHRFTALRDVATEIEWAKNRRVGAKDYLEALAGHEGHDPPLPPELMHRVFVTYEKRKRKAGVIDFEDLLEQTIDVLEHDPRALGIVRGRYHALTVDEYQDVNLLQQTLLDLWLGARDDLCVVGDDYQSIFGFTGATPRYLLRFSDRWEHTTVITLQENYRSSPEVLTVANRLVPRLGGSAKRLRATREAGPAPQLLSFDSGPDEVRAIVERCHALHQLGVAWEEMAILVRINGRSEDFEEAFAAAGVPYQVRDGSFLQRPAARAFGVRARRGTLDREAGAATRAIVDALGYDPMGRYEGGDEATRQADLHRLVQLAEGFDGDLGAFLADLALRFAPDQEGRGVQIMTYHRAKGLEFDAVFLPRLEEKELPFALATTDEDLAEERRLLYVGITRARQHLFLSHASSRPGERRTKPRPSRFLRELVPDQARAAAAAERSETPSTKEPRPGTDDPLFGRLRAWRREVAVEKGLPPYVIFHDSTLVAIAERRPSSRAALREVPGVGSVKMKHYGERLLAIIAEQTQAEDPVGASG